MGNIKITMKGKEVEILQNGIKMDINDVFKYSNVELEAVYSEHGVIINKLPKCLLDELDNYDLDPEQIPLPLEINYLYDSLYKKIADIYDISRKLSIEICKETENMFNELEVVYLNPRTKIEKFTEKNKNKDMYRYELSLKDLLKNDSGKYLIMDSNGLRVININNIHTELDVECVIGPVPEGKTVNLDLMQQGKPKLESPKDGSYPVLKNNKMYLLYPNYIEHLAPKYYNKVSKTLSEKWGCKIDSSEYYSRLVNFIELNAPAWSKPIDIKKDEYRVVECVDIITGSGEHSKPGLLVPVTKDELRQKIINEKWFPLIDSYDDPELFEVYGVSSNSLYIKALIWDVVIVDKEEK